MSINKKKIFINGLGCVSPQNTSNNDAFLENIENSDRGSLNVVKPDYKAVLKGINLRRMSHLIKMGVYAGKKAMEDFQDIELDAIITGTGLGASEDTEIFLDEVYRGNEGVTSPTRFIQSTHNTVGAQIALLLQCYSYNFTYVHRGASFESALIDGVMMFNEGRADHILVGGVDEITETYLNITGRMKSWKSESYNQLDLLSQKTSGTLPGEGSAFFYLSNKKKSESYAALLDLKILFKPKGVDVINKEIINLLEKNDLTIADIDVVLLGMNGDIHQDEIYNQLCKTTFEKCNRAYYKHLCGEYKTASSFGLWAACQMLHKSSVPEVVRLNTFTSEKVNNILLYNNYNSSNHSLILVQHV